ncbi:MAG: hypothetical protein IPP83_18065 [Flavobacteriales bacterium]|nr:hypothetical protein [Flavobacteriales bacterium]
MRYVSFATLFITFSAFGQNGSVSVTDDLGAVGRMDRPTKSLYELLGASHYSATFKFPGGKTHEVVLVMKSIYKDSVAAVDTLINSMRWKTMIKGGAPFDPKEEVFFVGQRVDSMHFKLLFRFGNMNMTQRTIELPWPNNGYMLDEGIRSRGKAMPVEFGTPLPMMVLTQPYPDPPLPKKAVIQRYCFGVDTPPEQWPATYGVPHLFVFELTVLP